MDIFSKQLASQLESIDRLLVLEKEIEEVQQTETSLQMEKKLSGHDSLQLDEALTAIGVRLKELREERKVLQKQFQESTEAVISAY